MKVCYLIQSHKNPAQILRMVTAILGSSPNGYVLISHDMNSSSLDPAIFAGMPNVNVILTRSSRSAYAFIEAYRDAVNWLLENEIEFDWLLNLSGQCYPIKRLAGLEAMLRETRFDGFMTYFRIFSDESPWGIDEAHRRFSYRYYNFENTIHKSLELLLKSLRRVMRFQSLFRLELGFFHLPLAVGVRRRIPFDRNMLYGGWTFCLLSRRCIEYLHSRLASDDEMIGYFKSIAVPTESFFQTILLSSGQFGISNDCPVYFRFPVPNKGHPVILGQVDIPRLADSSQYFARKFDQEIDGAVLDRIDREFLGSP